MSARINGPAAGEAKALAFLAACDAAAIEHPGGNLFDHLQRTAAQLRVWDAREALILAGLCHATYGTDGFHVALLDLSRRDELAAIVGSEAEALVYFYGSCDRAFDGRTPDPERRAFRDRFSGSVAVPDDRMVRDFVELTFANELDVSAHATKPGLRDAIGRYLPTLRPFASAAAWASFAQAYGVRPS